MKSQYLLILLLSCWLPGQAQDDLNRIRKESKEQILKTLKKNDIVGATMAVVSSEGILWTDHFGFADAEAKQPVTEETLFGLGSVTKVFTATAVMQLAEQGLIDLDNPLNEYLPSFQMKGGNVEVTPRNVLTHHSGLPSDIFKGMLTRQPEDYKSVIDYMNQEYMAGIIGSKKAG